MWYLLMWILPIFLYYIIFWLCWFFSSCGEQGLLSCCWAQALGHTGFSSWNTWAQYLQLPGPRAQAQELWYMALSCLVACGIFPDQGSNPCLLHWQADSLPLSRQGSPLRVILNGYMVDTTTKTSLIFMDPVFIKWKLPLLISVPLISLCIVTTSQLVSLPSLLGLCNLTPYWRQKIFKCILWVWGLWKQELHFTLFLLKTQHPAPVSGTC